MSSSPQKQQRARWWSKITRDVVLFSVALGLITLTGLGLVPSRPELYPLYAGMVGLGPILRYAENRQREQDKEREQ